MTLANAETEKEFIEGVRGIFRAYVPESDAWARPNFFDINATVIGGLAWSSYNEARNGIDSRLNLRTAVGEALDLLASTPPLDFTRLRETKATGTIRVICSDETALPAGTVFTTEGGMEFLSVCDVDLIDGGADIEVCSSEFGASSNSPPNQPFSIDFEGKAFSLGIFGGSDAECDDDFRKRIFSSPKATVFIGGQESYRNVISGYAGVSRVFFKGNYAIVLMEGARPPYGLPTESDLLRICSIFEDNCLMPVMCPPILIAPTVLILAPEITWCVQPDVCAVQKALTCWLRENIGLGEDVKGSEILAFLIDNFREYGPSLDVNSVFCAGDCEIYNTAELLDGC